MYVCSQMLFLSWCFDEYCPDLQLLQTQGCLVGPGSGFTEFFLAKSVSLTYNWALEDSINCRLKVGVSVKWILLFSKDAVKGIVRPNMKILLVTHAHDLQNP